jgi:hypothetical protein
MRALHWCHCAGGLLVGIDGGCVVLGAQSPSRTLPFLVGLPEGQRLASPVVASTPALPKGGGGDDDHDEFAGRAAIAAARAHSEGQWDGLIESTLSFDGAAACVHGFSAVGLPAGSALVVLSHKRFSVRAVLSSTPPLLLSQTALKAHDECEAERERRRRIDAERTVALSALEAAVGIAPPLEVLGSACAEDAEGNHRGPCERCNACAGYATPLAAGKLPPAELCDTCWNCGCASRSHELRSRRVDRTRREALRSIAELIGDAPPEVERSGIDRNGQKRGGCRSCGECFGYCLPRFPSRPAAPIADSLRSACWRCGCAARCHEEKADQTYFDASLGKVEVFRNASKHDVHPALMGA